MEKLLTLCIPTNGISEWVFPVLDSILCQNANPSYYEILVADNGDNKDFKNMMNRYLGQYDNISYYETTAQGFINQIYAFKLAQGQFIKFINHRMTLNPGAVNYLVDFSRKNVEKKPAVFFSNTAINEINSNIEVSEFSEFIRKLGYFSSWSAGLAMWKEDISTLDQLTTFNPLFPHTDILFLNKNKKSFIIDNTSLVTEMKIDPLKKAKYNVFYAFGVEFPSIILKLYQLGYITEECLFDVVDSNEKFLVDNYYNYIIRKKKNSYSMEYYKKWINFIYDEKKIKRKAYLLLAKKIFWGKKYRKNS